MKNPHFVLRTAWLCAALLAATVSVAGASPVTVQFYTDGVFYLGGNPATGTSSIANPSGGVQISFAGVGTSEDPISVTSEDSPFFQNLGTFTVTRGNNNSEFDFSAYSFQLAIFQSGPSVGNGTLLGLLDGTIKQNGEIDFSGGLRTTIGGVTYTLTNLDPGNVIFLNDLGKKTFYTEALDSNILHTHPETTGGDETRFRSLLPSPCSASVSRALPAADGAGAVGRSQIARIAGRGPSRDGPRCVHAARRAQSALLEVERGFLNFLFTKGCRGNV